MPEADELVLEYLGNSDVIILNVLYDEFEPYSCSAWADHGNSDLPVMIKQGQSISSGGPDSFSLEGLFFDATLLENNSMPKHVFIDHELNVYYKKTGFMSNNEVSNIIDEMLELMGEE